MSKINALIFTALLSAISDNSKYNKIATTTVAINHKNREDHINSTLQQFGAI